MKILSVFGTRPEAIKLAPLIKEMGRHKYIENMICVTAQHRCMLDQVLNIFNIKPDYDLDIMASDQDLFDIVSRCMIGLRSVLKKAKPDLVVVQGDTATAFISGLAASYLKIPVAHVEAGLRTYDKHSPFPEEMNRRLISVIADYHFAPTEWAKKNLIREGVPPSRVWVTGNTVIDALLMVRDVQRSKRARDRYSRYFKDRWKIDVNDGSKIILVTGHRRESFGQGFKNICMALKEIAGARKDVAIIYPVHLNPNVQKPVRSILSNKPNIHLIQPLEYDSFISLMNNSYLVLTDSGGIQEEAPSLKKPVLLMRDTTERPEGIKAGTVKMVGTNKDRIVRETLRLLDDRAAYIKMSRAVNPYGDGNAAKRIISVLREEITGMRRKR